MYKLRAAIYWIVFILFLTYVVLCAINVPLTVDEAWSYVEFVKGDFWNVVTYAHPTANNHILNSLLVKPFATISNSELSLRMPNVLAYVLYLYASYKISSMLFENKFFQVVFFIAMQCNITMLHFFAMCRGYGLSIGLMLFSLSQLISYIKYNGGKWSMHLSLLAAVLAMYASFTLLYFLAAVLIAFFLVNFAEIKTNWKKFLLHGIFMPFLYFCLMLVLCYSPIDKGIRAGEFFWGGEKNFVDDTLFTFLQDIIGYNVANIVRDPAMTLLILIVLFGIITPFIKLRKRNKIHQVAPLILLSIIAFINIQFYFFTSKIIIHRTALFLFPLIVLSVFSAIPLFNFRKDKMVYGCYGAFTLLLLIITVVRLDLSPVEEWWFEKDNKRILHLINKEVNPDRQNIRLLTFVFCCNSLNYYIDNKYPGRFRHVANMRAEDVADYSEFDYLYLPKYYPIKQKDLFEMLNDHYCNDRMVLYRKRKI